FVNKSLFSPRAPLFTKNFNGKTFFLRRKNILQLFLLFHFYGSILVAGTVLFFVKFALPKQWIVVTV
ncbi:MAG: hypothetical protein IJW35_05355, partial [Lentisphaeria bacterium]|nr:hypothetical protein [Lentisphaeria bacterium]